MEFNALTDFTDDEYNAFVAWLTSACADELKTTRGDRDGTRVAIERFIRRGYESHLSPSELIDFFGVSSGCVLEAAGLSHDDADAAMAAFDELNTAAWRMYHGS